MSRCFFFQAEDGIRDLTVTGVQTCALPIYLADYPCDAHLARYKGPSVRAFLNLYREDEGIALRYSICGDCLAEVVAAWLPRAQIGRASCRERVYISVVAATLEYHKKMDNRI